MTPKEEVLQACNKFKDALFDGDYDSLNELLCQDYRSFNLAGQVEYRDLVLEVYGKNKVQLDKFDVSDMNIDVFENIGIVTGKGYIRGRFKNEVWEHDLRFCDIYVKRESKWQLFFSQGTPIINIK